MELSSRFLFSIIWFHHYCIIKMVVCNNISYRCIYVLLSVLQHQFDRIILYSPINKIKFPWELMNDNMKNILNSNLVQCLVQCLSSLVFLCLSPNTRLKSNTIHHKFLSGAPMNWIPLVDLLMLVLHRCRAMERLKSAP